MSYLFSFLVLANALLLGYLLLTPKKESADIQSMRANLQAPVSFENTTDKLPLEIGKK
ncbi:MAG: hypothetical protein Q4A69_05935 [Moraxella sp.]|nr:hypothetical protein [Moraxella sp.]